MKGILKRYTDRVASEYAKLKYEDDKKAENKRLPHDSRPGEILFEWDTIDRPYISVSPQFFKWATINVIILVIISVIFLQWIFAICLVVIYLSLNAFLTSEPENVTHQITSNGIFYAKEDFFTWNMLHSFYISSRGNYEYLVVRTIENFPGELHIIIENSVNIESLTKQLNGHLPYYKPESGDNYFEQFFNKYIKS